jgi:F0F1-type ATP synthase delta subunit
VDSFKNVFAKIPKRFKISKIFYNLVAKNQKLNFIYLIFKYYQVYLFSNKNSKFNFFVKNLKFEKI